MTPADWDKVRATLGIPWGWTLRPHYHAPRPGDDPLGYLTLTATGKDPLPCGHCSMQVTATTLPLAVARMAHRLDFHRRYCG